MKYEENHSLISNIILRKTEAQARKWFSYIQKKVKNIPIITQFLIFQVTVSHGFEYASGFK